MGNICGKGKDTGAENNEKAAAKKQPVEKANGTSTATSKISSNGNRSTILSLHEGLLNQQTGNVYGKYEEVEVLGTGSMGHVARVKCKNREEKWSAHRTSTDVSSDSNHGNLNSHMDPQKTTSSISERRKVEYALKSIQLDRVSPTFVDELNNEIDILKALDHPNIVKLHEVFYQTNKQIFLILELCDGGDLYTRLPYTGACD